jgi:transposase-like protein
MLLVPIPPPIVCRLCNAHDYVSVGKSSLGAKSYACAGCTAVFMDPTKWSKPSHEQLTPGLAHLMPRSKAAGP